MFPQNVPTSHEKYPVLSPQRRTQTVRRSLVLSVEVVSHSVKIFCFVAKKLTAKYLDVPVKILVAANTAGKCPDVSVKKTVLPQTVGKCSKVSSEISSFVATNPAGKRPDSSLKISRFLTTKTEFLTAHCFVLEVLNGGLSL